MTDTDAADWSISLDGLDWHELEALYRAAPLGNKSAEGLRTAFTHSLFRVLVRERGRLVGAEEDAEFAAYLCSDLANCFVGQVFPVCGGWVMR